MVVIYEDEDVNNDDNDDEPKWLQGRGRLLLQDKYIDSSKEYV